MEILEMWHGEFPTVESCEEQVIHATRYGAGFERNFAGIIVFSLTFHPLRAAPVHAHFAGQAFP